MLWGPAEGTGMGQSGAEELRADIIALCNSPEGYGEVGVGIFSQVTEVE